MKIEIYQIDRDKDKDKHLCLSYNMINGDIDLLSYDLVFKDENFPEYSLDDIYEMFNMWAGNPYRHAFKGHSLSVSDVIAVKDSGDERLPDGYYFVDSFGFKDITGYCNGYWKCLNEIGDLY